MNNNVSDWRPLFSTGKLIQVNTIENTISIEADNFNEAKIPPNEGNSGRILFSFSLNKLEEDWQDWFFDTATIGDNITVGYDRASDYSDIIYALNISIEGHDQFEWA